MAINNPIYRDSLILNHERNVYDMHSDISKRFSETFNSVRLQFTY